MVEPTPWTALRHHRIKAGMTKLRLAAATGFSVSHICMVELGQRGAGPALYGQLAKVLDVDIDELIASAPKPPPQVTPSSAVAS
jgi:transcriptional regulator with XRE-family HTH domain